MGHLINPVTIRLDYNVFWKSNWSIINSLNYVLISKQDLLLFKYLNWIIFKQKFLNFDFLISHFKVFRKSNYIYINFFYYNTFFESKNFKNFSEKFLKILMEIKVLKTFNAFDNNIWEKKFSYYYKFLCMNLYWYILVQNWTFFLKKISFFTNNNYKFLFNIYNLDTKSITPEIIARYIGLKLTEEEASLNKTLSPILKDLENRLQYKEIEGYKIMCSGRFSKKQRATHYWIGSGKRPLSSLKDLIKYSSYNVRLRNGMCGIKVWLIFKKNSKYFTVPKSQLMYPFYLNSYYTYNKKTQIFIIRKNSWFYMHIRLLYFKNLRVKDFYCFLLKKFKILFLNVYQYSSENKMLKGLQIIENNLTEIKIKCVPVDMKKYKIYYE